MKKKRIIGIVGMPGAGKSVASSVARDLGFPVVVMGDVIREETKKRGLELTPSNMGKVMLNLRREEGSAVVAKRCIPKIDEAPGSTVVVEGIRSLAEVEAFKETFPFFFLIAIHSSQESRFERLFKRKRSDDPRSWDIFVKRDLRELRVGIGSAIAMADKIIVNEGTLDKLKTELNDVFRELFQ